MRVLCGSRGESHIATNVDLSTYEFPNGCWLVVFQWLEWFYPLIRYHVAQSQCWLVLSQWLLLRLFI